MILIVVVAYQRSRNSSRCVAQAKTLGIIANKRAQGASHYSDEFCQYRSTVLDGILRAESHPNVNTPCPCKRPNARRRFHCHDCHSYPMSCADCFLTHHEYNPFHWALEWCDDGFFVKSDLTTIRRSTTHRNYIVTFGHQEGGECPSASYEKPISFTVVDVTGIHTMLAVFCCCATGGSRRLEHLLASQIFPATFKQPTTGFTFNVLRDFHQHTLSSKKNVYDYVDALKRKTNSIFPHKVPDIYRQFLRAQRYWRATSTLIRSGQCHNIDAKFPYRPKGNIIPPCFACPEPGFNIAYEEWEDVDPDMDHVQLLCLMLDGHFGLQRLAKVDDPDDRSLLTMLGADGLFPNDDHYNNYLRDAGAVSVEKSTCANFSAVAMQNKYKFANCVITGVVGAECARHCCFLSMVDLQAGEKYANTDYALTRALKRIVGANSLDRAKYFHRIVVTYDVACQYSVNLGERLQNGFPDISDVIDRIKMYVPKFHLAGHKDDCKFLHALEWLARAGRLHGEGIEQTWSEAKQAGSYTRQMNHGHRHDTLTDLFLYYNECKIGDQPESLSKSLKIARAKRAEFVDDFLGMSVTYGRAKVEAWQKEDIQPHFKDGEWTSVFRVSTRKLPTQESIYNDLVKAETAVTQSGNKVQRTDERVTFILTGIKLQHRLYLNRATLSSFDDESRVKELASLRAALGRWRKQQARLMPLLDSVVASALGEDHGLEEEQLYLPSDLASHEHPRYGLTELAEIEAELRRGEANDAITLICQGIKHKMVLIKDKLKQANSVKLNTRSVNWIKETSKKIDGWAADYRAADYRRARRALVALDARKNTKDFPPLTDHDLTFKNAAGARTLGSGTSTDSWIWTFGNLRGLQDFEPGGYMEMGASSCSTFPRRC
ncbi:hypothetical protein EV715DRAFT_214149 [Schizophyllum commune]